MFALLAIGALCIEPISTFATNTKADEGTWLRGKKKIVLIDNNNKKSTTAYDVLTGGDGNAKEGMFNVFQRGNDYFF